MSSVVAIVYLLQSRLLVFGVHLRTNASVFESFFSKININIDFMQTRNW